MHLLSLFHLGNRSCPSCSRPVPKKELELGDSWRCKGCGVSLTMNRVWGAIASVLVLVLSYRLGHILRFESVTFTEGTVLVAVIVGGIVLTVRSAFDSVILYRPIIRRQEG